MVNIQLLGMTIDSQIVIGVVAIAVAVVGIILNNRKKSAHTSKMDSSQSAINSSGIVQQSASKINIDKQIIIQNRGEKFEEIKKLKKIEDIERQLTELYQPLENEIREYMDIPNPGNDENIIDLRKEELKRKFRMLETNYPGQIDREVFLFATNFFDGKSPAAAFRATVSRKVRDLRTEKEQFLKSE